MIVTLLCLAAVCAGVVMIVRWGGRGAAPDPVVPAVLPMRRRLGVAFGAGAIAGVLAAGAGGRLVMRLLAATSPESHGLLTEGQAVIGDITLGGTLGLLIFAGIPFGLASGLLWAAIGGLLPRGRIGGAVFGVLLLVFAASRVDPLRESNFDFNLLGPDWLSVVAFTVLALFHGMLVAACHARLSGGAVAWLWNPRALTVGRVAVGLAAVVALPGFVSAVAAILGGETG